MIQIYINCNCSSPFPFWESLSPIPSPHYTSLLTESNALHNSSVSYLASAMKLVWACIALLAVQAASAGSSSELSTEVKVRDKREHFLSGTIHIFVFEIECSWHCESLVSLSGFIGDLVEGAGDILGGVGDALGGVVGALTGPLGGVIGNFIGGIFGGNKGDEAAEARHRWEFKALIIRFKGTSSVDLSYCLNREQMAMMRNQHCIANCVSEWSPWTACSQPCGGGTTTRSRQETIPSDCGEGFSCGKQLSQEAPCNPGCPNGAVPKSGGGCECPDGFRGQCCNQGSGCTMFSIIVKQMNLDSQKWTFINLFHSTWKLILIECSDSLNDPSKFFWNQLMSTRMAASPCQSQVVIWLSFSSGPMWLSRTSNQWKHWWHLPCGFWHSRVLQLWWRIFFGRWLRHLLPGKWAVVRPEAKLRW